MNARRLLSGLCLSVLCLAAASPAFGLANRVFVSARSGNDANACDNILTPCQTFAGAVSKVNPGGEVIVLDSGGYGPVLITQSVTIEAPPGVLAFIHPPSGPAVHVTASDATLVLRGLTLNVGSTDGVAWFGSGTLHIENCVINGFSGRGIGAYPFTHSALFIKDTIVRGNTLDGVLLQPAGGILNATIDRCRVEQNLSNGVAVRSSSVGHIVAVVRDTVLSGNGNIGLLATTTDGGTARASADRCNASQNNFGMLIEGLSAALRLQGSSITYNSSGLSQGSSALVETIGNNIVRGNFISDKTGIITIVPGD